MQDLTVIGVEDGSLLVSSDDGARYRIAIDETLTSTIRQSVPLQNSVGQGSAGQNSFGLTSFGQNSAGQGAARKLSPREIQTHIRSGMSAEDVAAITGAPLEYIERFEGPVLAEREYVIESALNVQVHTAIDPDPMTTGATFGSVIRERLHDLGATDERWASWKEAEGGWVVKLSFTANEIDHDARWKYEPKRAALAPINGEAHTLSQQGELAGGLIPRLRAVGGDERPADSSRFDSGAFDVKPAGDVSVPYSDRPPFGRNTESSPEVSDAAIKRAPVEEVESNQTADLLEALRRRRGEREAAGAYAEDETMNDHPSTGAPSTGRFRLVDVPLDAFADDVVAPTPQPSAPQVKGSSKKGRSAMPSWDEIVFGARSDDDPA